MSPFPCLVRSVSPSGEARYALGDPLVDRYLEFVAGRCRPNTLRAVAFDLKMFFTVVDKDPVAVTAGGRVRVPRRISAATARWSGSADRESGLSARTIARRLSSVSGFYAYLVARGDTPVTANPVPRGLADPPAGRPGAARCRWCGCRGRCRRSCRRPRSTRCSAALRTRRDRAMVLAMLLGGLRRCEVLGLRLGDVQVADRRGVRRRRQGRPSTAGADRQHVLHRASATTSRDERPPSVDTDRVFVVLKGPRRGRPLTADGLDEILAGARRRAGLERGTCHQLRHTCLTRLREAGMALEAVQAQAGHRSIESTRIYLHLTNDWLAGEYRRAAELIDADHAAELLAAAGGRPA